MIFFFNSNGNPIDLIPSSVYQGSDKASEIFFACPVADTSAISAAFTLPDGSSVGGYILSLESGENSTGFFDENEVPVNVWKMDVPLALTKDEGEVAVQFTVSNAQGEVIKTATNTFTVERGVQISAPTEVETFQNVLTYLSDIYNKITADDNTTLAGLNIKDGITAEELKTALSINNVENTSDLNKPVSTATQTALDSKQNVMQYSTMPTASEEKENQIIQYVGETTSAYTNGRFYKCKAQGTTPETYAYEEILFGVVKSVNGETGDVNLTFSDVGALSEGTKYGADLSLTINTTTFVMTAQLLDQNGNNLGTAKTIDLPLESVVVSGRYDNANKKIVLTLQNGSEIDFSVADLVGGLVPSTRKVAGINLEDDITTVELKTALSVTNNYNDLENQPVKNIVATSQSKVDTQRLTLGGLYKCVGNKENFSVSSLPEHIPLSDSGEVSFILKVDRGTSYSSSVQTIILGNYYARRFIIPGAGSWSSWEEGILSYQCSVMPYAREENENQIIQYAGETDSTYENGHFYKSKAQGTDPETYAWEEISFGASGNYLKEYNSSDFANWAACWAQAKIDGVILVKGHATYINNNAYNSLVFNSAGTKHGQIIFTDGNNGTFQFRYVYNDAITNTGMTAKNTMDIPLPHAAYGLDKGKVWTAGQGANEGSWDYPENGRKFAQVLQYTVQEDDTDSVIEMTEASGGTAFNYDGVFVKIEVPQGDTAFNYQVQLYGNLNFEIAFFTTASSAGVLTTDTTIGAVKLDKSHGMWSGRGVSGITAAWKTEMKSESIARIVDTNTEKAKKVIVKSQNGTDTFPAGTVITVYGY